MVRAEVVVLGAGISGLLIGSELAQRHEVVILEKAERLPDTKYWLTDQGSVDLSPDLASAVDTVYPAMAFTAYDGTSYLAPGSFHMWDSTRLLAALTTRLTQGNGRILFGQRFYSFHTDKQKAVVYANARRIECRLVIDCMGVDSPIIYAKHVADVLGFYLLYGATFRLQGSITPVALHNLMLSHQPAWVEAFPTSDGRLHLVLIVPTAKLRPASDLKTDFQFIATKSPYAAHIASPTDDRKFLGGVVPVTRIRKQALDRVFFYGEAGQVNPAASATALTRMLYNRQAIANHLSECLRLDRLDATALASHQAPAVGPLNQRIQRALFRGILHWDSDDYLRIIRELIALDDARFANHLMFGDMPETFAAVTHYAARLLRTRSIGLLKAVLRSLILPVV